ncbi:MAG: hypothetical protein AABW51_01065 [Nanoarchaeota archaeon]
MDEERDKPGGMECKVIKIDDTSAVVFAGIDSIFFSQWYAQLQTFRNYGGFQSHIHPEVEKIVRSGFNINKYYLNSNDVWTAS